MLADFRALFFLVVVFFIWQTYGIIVLSRLYYKVNKFHFKVLKRNKKKNIRVIQLIK